MKKFVWLMLMCTSLFQGCASYKAGVLPSRDVFLYDNRQEQEGLNVAVNILDAAETKRIFQFKLQSKNVQPVYLVIDNRSEKTYEFSKANINKQCYSSEEVSDKFQFNTAGRATAYGVAGLFIWPLLVPAVVDGVGSSNANQRIQDDYAYKSIQDKSRIAPNGMLTGIVFVPNLKPGEDFTIRLTDVKENTVKRFSFRY